MYFEIFRNKKLIKRGNDIVNDDLSWDNELMLVPALSITLPITYHDYITGRDEIKVFANNKCFWGIVDGLEEDKAEELLHVDLVHVVNEWTYRQISVNNAVKDKKVNIVYKGSSTVSKNGENITASPFTLLMTEVSMSDAKYIKRAGAFAWTDSGDVVSVTAVDISAVSLNPGTYTVKFSTANGTSVSVDATVKKIEGLKTSTKAGITVAAVPFELTVSETGSFSTSDYISRAYAMAWNDDGEVSVSADYSGVSSSIGTYNVKFTAGTSSLTVKANVLANGSEIHLPDTTTNADVVSDASVVDELTDIYADMNFAYPGWTLNMSDDAGSTTVDYVYSRQNKLEALNKTMELTTDLFWRVRFVDEKVIDISSFGDKKEWIFSKKPTGANNIRIIEEPIITHSFENVINIASVYSDKSDSGMSSLTLREVYNDTSLQKDGFPCVILRANVNNERDYSAYVVQYPKLAPNNELEYAVIDEESVALESGTLIEGTYAFNDLSPFTDKTDSKEIKDKERIRAAKAVYHAVIRKLKQARRSYQITLSTEELPVDLAPGDRVRLIYDNSVYILDSCSHYMKKILSFDDWFYITKISYNISYNGVEKNEVVLEKFLRIDRDTKNE